MWVLTSPGQGPLRSSKITPRIVLQKTGVSPPCFFLCKKCQKTPFFLKIVAFFGVFWPIFGHFWPKSRKNAFSVGGVCYEKNARQGLSSAWQKPANLYSTKCRIFGIWPPVGGHRGGLHHFLRRRPPPEVDPRPPGGPPPETVKNTHVFFHPNNFFWKKIIFSIMRRWPLIDFKL